MKLPLTLKKNQQKGRIVTSEKIIAAQSTGNLYQYYSDEPATNPCGLNEIFNMTCQDSSATYYMSFVGIGDNGDNISYLAILDKNTLAIVTDDLEVIVFT